MTRKSSLPGYSGLGAFVGDLHNHCGISYGHGSLEDALTNARLQLDFASVTGHAAWPDIPDEERLAGLRQYHLEGFARLRGQWETVLERTEAANVEGKFVTFPSFEWHSMEYGDHCIYAEGGSLPLLDSPTLVALRADVRALVAPGRRMMMVPHHVGYRRGFRGANWEAFDSELTPIVEMVSMHGAAETDDGPRPYLHTMGPVDGDSTVWRAWEQGLRFGVIGSTDHHSAHPGSHGYGRAMVWASGLSRSALWDGIAARQTYAVTGDPMVVATTVGGAPMGGEARVEGPVPITYEVRGLDRLTSVEVLRNNVVIHRSFPVEVSAGTWLTGVSFGWGESGVPTDWTVRVSIEGGCLEAVEPRLHGHDIVDPTAALPERYAFSAWRHVDDHTVELTTRTQGNPTVRTDATQGMSLRVTGDERTVVEISANGRIFRAPLGRLKEGSVTGYLDGFVSGAVKLHRAVRESATVLVESIVDDTPREKTSWYSVRASQINDQHAWSSPTWVVAV
ncbi:PHP domain-containing protein [Tessaracoccus antarcticus]|uniref:DUF3604 domain-containing protein n=1 Tax=Tessaracoccus antarcticus TaxID=2479848 RepID=A0A3M0G4R8_9ACTN|nr:hypothetical protein [Tessaracoccus antarcticus]RMB57222.1 hypothetical protein EAX62_15875 [Tessaracoccus antarcticus]